ncbi:cob(I)yrinic acid a,c-diamide adenosyltransferase [Parvicella tangerina]|uniref:Corrinoid adenosyltransferase n=1 Tax=Parvicella tangerina TaxID=2829795 RepID=A0A916NDP0_9FLAO|nr:cob(I)yrinic acid a,c-diamide adenosyltransferase [Parvicella tangerina]CAG5085596.1 Corrinoid adenosyltransferase [Parvicella tangerina]
MKVYTKTGDTGETSLFGGKRVKKYNVRIEAYGTSDELNSWIGLIISQSIHEDHKSLLIEVQDRIFTLGAQLAADPDKPKLKMPRIKQEDILLLEERIDKMDEDLPEMTKFTLPGGNTIVSYCHLARCVCRRCERRVIELADQAEVEPLVIQYLNRLSDYLFVLGRKLAQETNASEVFWEPKNVN